MLQRSNNARKASLNKRIEWVDYAKGIGICLVVIGHVIRGLLETSIFSNTTFVEYLDAWIYAFHMPLFFFLSGLFLDRSGEKQFSVFVLNKSQTLIYPYFIWSLIQLTIVSILNSNDSIKSFLANLLSATVIPQFHFWFLYTLFLIMLIYAVTKQIKFNIYVFILLTIFFHITYIYNIRIGTYIMLYRIRRYAIYVSLGIVTKKLLKLNNILQYPNKYLIAFVGGGSTIIAITVVTNIINERYLTLLIALLGIAVSISLAVLFTKWKSLLAIKTMGRYTLSIYLVHIIVIAAIRSLFLNIGIVDPIVHLFFETIAGIYIPIYLYKFCLKTQLRYLFSPV